MKKEIKIIPPEGYVIDKENSTLECIKFKLKSQLPFRYNDDAKIEGYYIDSDSEIRRICDIPNGCREAYNIFTTEKLAKSAIAIARISQIIANDKRFGGVITEEEWHNNTQKYAIVKSLSRDMSAIVKIISTTTYYFLAFHTDEQRTLFMEENIDLIKDYLMID